MRMRSCLKVAASSTTRTVTKAGLQRSILRPAGVFAAGLQSSSWQQDSGHLNAVPRALVTWDDVDMVDEAKAFLKAAGIKASLARRMDRGLGVNTLHDLRKLDTSPGSKHYELLRPKEMEEETLREAVAQLRNAALQPLVSNSNSGGSRSMAAAIPLGATTGIAAEQGGTTAIAAGTTSGNAAAKGGQEARAANVVRIGNGATIQQLGELLTTAADLYWGATIFDLQGQTLGEELIDDSDNKGDDDSYNDRDADSNDDLLLAAPGVTLRNGTLQLPRAARMILRGQGARLENIKVSGEYFVGNYGEAHGLVWIDGAKEVVLHGCTVEPADGNKYCAEYAVQVDNGASAELSECNLSGGERCGLFITGARTTAVVKNIKLGDKEHNGCGVLVAGGAFAYLQGGDARGNFGAGLLAHGSGTRLVARGCRSNGFGCDAAAVVAREGATAELTGCILENGEGWPVACAEDYGTRIELRACVRGAPIDEDKDVSEEQNGKVEVAEDVEE